MTPFSRHLFFRLTGLTRELDYLESEDEQRAVWKVVSERMWTRGYLHKRGLWVLAIAVATLILVFRNRLNAFTPVGAGKSTLNEWYFWYLAMVFISYLSYWLMRSQYRRVLRERLCEIGVPICIGCGYNLIGTPKQRCPECGQKTEIDDAAG